jgi:hypothetical protein
MNFNRKTNKKNRVNWGYSRSQVKIAQSFKNLNLINLIYNEQKIKNDSRRRYFCQYSLDYYFIKNFIQIINKKTCFKLELIFLITCKSKTIPALKHLIYLRKY